MKHVHPIMLMLILGLSGAEAFPKIWANNGDDKVTREELRCSADPASVHHSIWNGTTIFLFGARNEVVSFNLTPNSVFSGILDQMQQVKTQTQSAIYQDGNWLGDLTQMEPGKGYTFFMTAPTTLTYPLENRHSE